MHKQSVPGRFSQKWLLLLNLLYLQWWLFLWWVFRLGSQLCLGTISLIAYSPLHTQPHMEGIHTHTHTHTHTHNYLYVVLCGCTRLSVDVCVLSVVMSSVHAFMSVILM